MGKKRQDVFSGSSSSEKTYLLKNTSSQSHIFTNTNLLKRTSSQTHILSNTHLGKHESSQTHIFSKTHLLALGHWPLADGSHIGGVAAGVHPVGSPWAGTMCAGPTGARCLPAPKQKCLNRAFTTPPAAPSGQRAADVRPARSGAPLMLRALGHWKTTVRRTTPNRGMLATGSFINRNFEVSSE